MLMHNRLASVAPWRSKSPTGKAQYLFLAKQTNDEANLTIDFAPEVETTEPLVVTGMMLTVIACAPSS